jgi:thioredoxin-related protein
MKHIIQILIASLAILTHPLIGAVTGTMLTPSDVAIVNEDGRTIGSIRISSNQSVEILSTNTTNTLIKFGEIQGWVASDHLEVEQITTATNSTTNATPTPIVAAKSVSHTTVFKPATTPTPTPTPTPSPSIINSAYGESHQSTWLTNMEEAVALATSQHKMILIDATEPDRNCPFCKLLNENVLSNNKFLRTASEHAVLLRSTFIIKQIKGPEDMKKLSTEDLLARKLREKYGVSGYPTLLLINPDGSEISRKKGYPSSDPLGSTTSWIKTNTSTITH